MRQRIRYALFAVPVVLTLLVLVPSAPTAQTRGDWTAYASTNGSTRYSPLDQINKDNVKGLRIAWRQSGMPREVRQQVKDIEPGFRSENTPLKIGNLLYISTTVASAAALDAATGRVVWVDVPPKETGPRQTLGGTASRGLAYWTDGRDERVIAITGDYLVALNAKTGARIAGFGENGAVDLAREGYPREVNHFRWSSGPLILRDVIVTAGLGAGGKTPEGNIVSSGDYTSEFSMAIQEGAPGNIRGFDVRTGKMLWTFNTIPRPGEFGNETWLSDAWAFTGDAQSWAPLSGDDELGYVYAATGTPTSDYWGGKRPGNNLFAESLICLDARTGKRVWHFQAVHHGIWDFDFPAAPVLGDITVNGRKIKAVAQVSKQGFAYVFDRVTGTPVWPIDERPVPKGDVPGEWYSPTQPFPTKPPAYDQQGITVDDLVDFTPELRAEALKIVSEYRYGPLFTPPSVADPVRGTHGTLIAPGTNGTVWNSAAFDADMGVLYIAVAQSATRIELVKPKNPKANLPYTRKDLGKPDGPQGLPSPFKPPYGKLVAIDLNKGDIIWNAANGEGPRNHPAIKHLNLPPLGQGGRAGPLVTKSLVFLGEGGNVGNMIKDAGGKMFRAFDKASGKVVWEMELPGGTTGTPMSYMVNGKQYIAVNVGWDKDCPTELVALALP